MTHDEIVREMEQAGARCAAAIVELAAGYQARAELVEQVVRGAHDEGGQFRAFDAANNPRLSQSHYAKNLLRTMHRIGLGGLLRHRHGRVR